MDKQKQYVAIYIGDVTLFAKEEISKMIIFQSKIIDGEMWFVMKGDETFAYLADTVFEDAENWIVLEWKDGYLERARQVKGE